MNSAENDLLRSHQEAPPSPPSVRDALELKVEESVKIVTLNEGSEVQPKTPVETKLKTRLRKLKIAALSLVSLLAPDESGAREPVPLDLSNPYVNEIVNNVPGLEDLIKQERDHPRVETMETIERPRVPTTLLAENLRRFAVQEIKELFWATQAGESVGTTNVIAINKDQGVYIEYIGNVDSVLSRKLEDKSATPYDVESESMSALDGFRLLLLDAEGSPAGETVEVSKNGEIISGDPEAQWLDDVARRIGSSNIHSGAELFIRIYEEEGQESKDETTQELKVLLEQWNTRPEFERNKTPVLPLRGMDNTLGYKIWERSFDHPDNTWNIRRGIASLNIPGDQVYFEEGLNPVVLNELVYRLYPTDNLDVDDFWENTSDFNNKLIQVLDTAERIHELRFSKAQADFSEGTIDQAQRDKMSYYYDDFVATKDQLKNRIFEWYTTNQALIGPIYRDLNIGSVELVLNTFPDKNIQQIAYDLMNDGRFNQVLEVEGFYRHKNMLTTPHEWDELHNKTHDSKTELENWLSDRYQQEVLDGVRFSDALEFMRAIAFTNYMQEHHPERADGVYIGDQIVALLNTQENTVQMSPKQITAFEGAIDDLRSTSPREIYRSLVDTDQTSLEGVYEGDTLETTVINSEDYRLSIDEYHNEVIRKYNLQLEDIKNNVHTPEIQQRLFDLAKVASYMELVRYMESHYAFSKVEEGIRLFEENITSSAYEQRATSMPHVTVEGSRMVIPQLLSSKLEKRKQYAQNPQNLHFVYRTFFNNHGGETLGFVHEPTGGIFIVVGGDMVDLESLVERRLDPHKITGLEKLPSLDSPAALDAADKIRSAWLEGGIGYDQEPDDEHSGAGYDIVIMHELQHVMERKTGEMTSHEETIYEGTAYTQAYERGMTPTYVEMGRVTLSDGDYLVKTEYYPVTHGVGTEQERLDYLALAEERSAQRRVAEIKMTTEYLVGDTVPDSVRIQPGAGLLSFNRAQYNYMMTLLNEGKLDEQTVQFFRNVDGIKLSKVSYSKINDEGLASDYWMPGEQAFVGSDEHFENIKTILSIALEEGTSGNARNVG